jgi:SAM-dependent methyltransferase
MKENEAYKRWREAQKAEFDFWKFQKRKKIPLPEESLERYEKCLKLVPLSITNLTKILDVGSGPYGGVSLFISKSCLKLSIDPLIGKKEFRNKESVKEIDSVRAVGECLPLIQNSFDIIFCVNALDHSYEPLRILNEINRVLCRRGVLILMVHVVTSKEKIIHRILCGTIFQRISFAIQRLRNFYLINKFFFELSALAFNGLDILNDSIVHPFYFMLKDVVAMLNQAGFTINKIKLCQSPWNYKQDLYLVAYKHQSDNPYAIVRKIEKHEPLQQKASHNLLFYSVR